jgi:hypothetical protein
MMVVPFLSWMSCGHPTPTTWQASGGGPPPQTSTLIGTTSDTLYGVFKEWMTSPADVFGARDVDGLLTRHTAVERRHAKLWLATGSQLFWSTHSELANRASALRQRVEESLPLYVLNRGYGDAVAILDTHRVCVIAGVPGIGKTMLAQVLLADAMSAGYEPIEVSGDIDEAWTALSTKEPQVFLYDDFLGQLSFSERLGKNEDVRLAAFISKVSSTESKRLIMTTREYILHDAQRVYERLRGLDERMHFVLALANYTRGDRARILYNHLWHAEVSEEALTEVASGGYRSIVDHANYSPRLIEYCTRSPFDTRSPGYANRVLHALDHPEHLWRVAFESHLTEEQRLLAVTLAAMPPRAEIGDLQTAHAGLSSAMSVPMTAAMFRAGLEVMEGTFIAIGEVEGEPTVTFHNPSIREFTLDWLADDPDLLTTVLKSATYFEQVRQLYLYATGSTRNGGHAALLAVLEAHADTLKETMTRTIYSETPERRTEWDHDEGSVYRKRSSWLEDRLEFLFSLDEPWAPAEAWVEEVLIEINQRWLAKQGWKGEAVKIMRKIEAVVYGGYGVSVSLALSNQLSRTLDGWLEQDLEDTDEDWVPYLERLKIDHHVVLKYQTEVAAAFEDHARDELVRWSPSPPSLDELKEYASEFELDELMEELDRRVEEDRSRDHETSEKVQHRSALPTPESADANGDDSDDALDQLFGRLARRRPEVEGRKRS